MFGANNITFEQVHKHIIEMFRTLETNYTEMIKEEKDNIGTPV